MTNGNRQDRYQEEDAYWEAQRIDCESICLQKPPVRPRAAARSIDNKIMHDAARPDERQQEILPCSRKQ